MRKNYLLGIADLFLKFAIGFTLLAGVMLFAACIHYQYNPDFYSNVTINDKGDVSLAFHTDLNEGKTQMEWKSGGDKVFFLNQLSAGNKVYMILHLLFEIFIVFMITWQLRKFVRSAQNHHTFYSENVIVFRKIGFCFLSLFVFRFIFPAVFSVNGGGIFVNYSLELQYLFLFIVAFIMGEVFREGEKLKAENDLTI